jgi:hypothetical protein
MFADNPDLRPEHWGAIVGLILGMSYSYLKAGKSDNTSDGDDA